jgi:predicted nucleic acid-binding protein
MYLLDTNTVMYFCNSKLPEGARNLLFSIDPAISVISRIELFANSNLPAKEKATLETFVALSRIYDYIDGEIVSKAVAIRQQYKTKLPDAIVAATALANDLTLITHNISDFRKITGLRLLDPLATNLIP